MKVYCVVDIATGDEFYLGTCGDACARRLKPGSVYVVASLASLARAKATEIATAYRNSGWRPLQTGVPHWAVDRWDSN